MTRCAVFVSCLGVFCFGITPTASAEPVTITGGSLVFATGDTFQAGPISLTGTRGFSLQGFVDSGESRVGALCTPCGSDVTIPLGVSIIGSALGAATATLDGQTYLDVNHILSPAAIALDLVGTTHLPPIQASPVVLVAPFTATGVFFLMDVQGEVPTVEVPIRGAGKVTLMLAPAPNSWDARGARFDFIQPTPEPATLTLMSGALVAAAIRARKRRDI